MKTRLDKLLVERGFFPSRTTAARAIMAGEVRDRDGAALSKPGMTVEDDREINLRGGAKFVSRGGQKLANALEYFNLDLSGRKCLDVGASTGGFTDCLLQARAEHVVALDVAYGEFAWSLREDSRVTVIERTNARNIRVEQLPYRPELTVVDLSFISLTKVLPAVLAVAASEFVCLALVKPQFEVGRAKVGRGGVVRKIDDRRAAVHAVAQEVQRLGFSVQSLCFSGLPGPAGNRETFLRIGRAGDLGAALRTTIYGADL